MLMSNVATKAIAKKTSKNLYRLNTNNRAKTTVEHIYWDVSG